MAGNPTSLHSIPKSFCPSFQQNSSRLCKPCCKSALTLMPFPWAGQLQQSKTHRCWVSTTRRAKIGFSLVKICAIFKLLNNFSECCWLFHPAPTCSWIWIKCTSFPAQTSAASAKETSACPVQERDSLRTTQTSLSAWLTDTFLKVSFWKNSPNCQAANVILHL